MRRLVRLFGVSALVALHTVPAVADPLPAARFLDDSQPWHEPASRAVDVQHLDLDLILDPAGQVTGHAIYSGVLRNQVRQVRLDAADLQLEEAAWLRDGKRLPVPAQKEQEAWAFDLPDDVTTAWRLELKWRAKPKRGMHFVQPDADAPQRPQHVWTQGESADAHFWLPCPDDPDERLSWDVAVTAPVAWQALSNGDLVARTVTGKQARTQYHFAREAPVYLLTIAAGPFQAISHPHPQTPLTSWVLGAVEEDARRGLATTPEILDRLNALTGVAYPWGRYGHVVVDDFTFGGMENVTLTTLTDRAMPDARDLLDWDIDGLIAHELAHQWFGDWLTCRTWADIWLNEGFASYFDSLVLEARKGRQRLDEDLADARASYLAEAAEYQRPIVTDRYRDADELFDRHTYQKGALVLHMLRRKLGDTAFFAGITSYLKSGPRSVETADFQRAMEDASGQSLRGFFARWLRQAGHPVLHAQIHWDPAQKTVRVTLRQKQEVSHGQPLFDLRVPLRIVAADGTVIPGSIALREAKAEYTLALAARPQAVELDPDMAVLADWTLEADDDDLIALREHGSTAEVRLQAVRALGKQLAHAPAVAALIRAAQDDPARHVRVAAVEQLGKAERAAVRETLQRVLQKDAEAPVRAAAALALGELHDLGSWPLLKRVLQKEASYATVRGAMTALHQIDRQEARELLRDAATMPSHRDTLAVHALHLLGQTGDERDGALLWDLAQPGNAKPLREGALPALAAWASRAAAGTRDGAREPAGRDKVRLYLESLLQEPSLRIRQHAAQALGVLGDPASRGTLLAAADREVLFRTAESMRRAARELGHKLPLEERVRRLEDQLEKLQREPQHKPAEAR